MNDRLEYFISHQSDQNASANGRRHYFNDHSRGDLMFKLE